jgi:hypothetical protein
MAEQNPPTQDPQSCPPLEVLGFEPATLLSLDGQILSKGRVLEPSSTGGKFFPNLAENTGNLPSGALLLEMRGVRTPILLAAVCTVPYYTIHQHFRFQ